MKIERGPGHCVNARKHCGLAEAKACNSLHLQSNIQKSQNLLWFFRQFLKVERGPGHCVNARKHCGLAEARACLYERAVPAGLAELAELYFIYAVTETALLCAVAAVRI